MNLLSGDPDADIVFVVDTGDPEVMRRLARRFPREPGHRPAWSSEYHMRQLGRKHEWRMLVFSVAERASDVATEIVKIVDLARSRSFDPDFIVLAVQGRKSVGQDVLDRISASGIEPHIIEPTDSRNDNREG